MLSLTQYVRHSITFATYYDEVMKLISNRIALALLGHPQVQKESCMHLLMKSQGLTLKA